MPIPQDWIIFFVEFSREKASQWRGFRYKFQILEILNKEIRSDDS